MISRRPDQGPQGRVEGPCFHELPTNRGEKVPRLRFAPLGTTVGAAASLEAGLDQLPEGAAAMADGVLLVVGHLGRGARVAHGLEARIVAVPTAAARRPDDAAIDRAVHQLDVLVRP